MKQKLYVFFSHGIGSCRGTHSLYALDLQSPDDKTPTIPTVTTTTSITTVLGSNTTNTTTTTVTPGEPERALIDPLLCFSAGFWPNAMTCALVGKKLYFLGGYRYVKSPKDTYVFSPDLPSTDVFSLDIASTYPASLENYRDRPEKIMTRCPSMLSGKINPLTTFTADDKLFVLSGCDTCASTGNKFKQFEILEDNKWVYGEDPPFHELSDLISYVIAKNQVIVIGHILEATCIYEYNIKFNRWAVLYTGCWTGLEKIPCHRFEQGGQFIGDKFYVMDFRKREDFHKRGLPVIVPFKYQDVEKNGNKDSFSPLTENKCLDVLPYSILTPDLSHTLTRVANNIFCFVQVGPPVHPSGIEEHWNGEKCYMSATQFSVSGDSGEYLNSAHYVKIPNDSHFDIVAAYVCDAGACTPGDEEACTPSDEDTCTSSDEDTCPIDDVELSHATMRALNYHEMADQRKGSRR